MKFLFGLLIGLLTAIGIAVGAAYIAFGDLGDIGNRDKSKDISRSYDLTGFEKIDIIGVYELNVKVGPAFSVAVSGSEEQLANIETSVDNGVLRLDQRDRDREHGKHRWRSYGATADITMPALSAVNVSGIVDGDITGVDADDFRIDISGVGDLEIEGDCLALTATFSGVGELDARSLECNGVKVDLSGVGEVEVFASTSVTADVSGIGSITVYGSPSQVEKSSGLMSTVSIK